MESIFDYQLKNLEEFFESIGEKKFKARQLFDWVYKKRVFDYDQMTNLSIDLRNKLKENLSLDLLKLRKKQTSDLTN